MNDLLPSRNITAFVLVPVVTILSVWAVLFVEREINEQEQGEKVTLSGVIQEGNVAFQNIDTDKDGLKDWEEMLYQTDVNNPDTDGDGASDGNEVQRGYDPLVAGNGETDIEVERESDFTFYKNDSTLSRTDVLSRDTFTSYLTLRESDALDQQALVERSLDNAIRENTQASSTIVYSLSDINIVQASISTRQAYFNAYKSHITILSRIQYDETELMARYLYENDAVAFEEIARNIATYQAFLNVFATMRVPSDIGPIHVEIMNNLAILIDSLENIQRVDQDPLTGLIYAEKLSEDSEILLRNISALSLYFRNNDL